MIAFIGHYLLVSSIILNMLAILLVGENKKRLYYFSSLLPAFSFASLISAFVTSDFSVKNVFFNSSTIKPLIYKVAAAWASHEGSMLLWIAMLSLIGSLSVYLSSASQKSKEHQISIGAFVHILFCCFLISTSNPFEEFRSSPIEGLGLNPVLQDVALSIHPPILYLGYVSYFGTFLAGCLLLLLPTEKEKLLKLCNFFSLMALSTLTTGISLGAWWAYRELGWGGYWFFDPVENISLLPWLTGIALHHFLICTKKTGQYLRWTVFLSILPFLLTIFGFFFVRSGIITSIHSFAFSAERGVYIFIICTTITLLSISLFVTRFSALKQEEPLSLSFSSSPFDSKIIISGNYLWLTAFFALLIAIIYPIYYSLVFSIDIAIDQGYYHKIFIPIFIPILLLAGLGLAQKASKYLREVITICIAICCSIPIIEFSTTNIITKVIIIAAIFLMLSSVDYILRVSNYLRGNLTNRNLAIFLGHFGSGLLALSIAINVTYSTQVNFSGKVGDHAQNDNLYVRLDKVKFADNPTYYRQIAQFVVRDKDGKEIVLRPENRLYKIENSVSQESDIYSSISHDLYAVLSLVKKDIINAEIFYKPMISLIWLGLFMIALSFLFLLVKRSTNCNESLSKDNRSKI